MSGIKKIGKNGGGGSDSPTRDTDAVVEQEMQDMFRDSLAKQLGPPDPSILKEINHQVAIDNPSFNSFYQNSEIKMDKSDRTIKTARINDDESNLDNSKHINYDVIETKSLKINEKLISLFSKHNKILGKDADILTEAIDLNQYILREIGTKFDKFNQDDYISGLEMPDQETSIKLVVANTKKFYKMSKIINYEIKNSALIIDFAGINASGENFFVRGKITPKRAWNGNEVIDYIYAENGGKMFVRAISIGENIKWSNQSEIFDIKYKLFDNIEKDSIDGKIQEGSSKIEELDSVQMEENLEEDPIVAQMVQKMKNINVSKANWSEFGN